MTFHTLRVAPDSNDEENNAASKRQSAVALGYDPATDVAPQVVASGQGFLAEKIIALAKKNGIPIREDTVLVNALASLEVNETIPVELYSVVAEVLAYVYRIREKQLNKS